MHDGHALYKMDKFSKIATDPFYAGVVCINKQIQFRNENGLHQPLITLQQHNEIVKIFNAKGKTQTGPRKNGNPEFPLSNLVSCSMCTQKRNGRYVGFNHSNGKNDSLVYQKYRCRSCGKYIKRDELHDKVEHYLKKYQLSPESSSAFIKALAAVWKREEAQTEQEVRRLERQIKDLKTKIKSQAAAAIEPSNAYIREDILANITDNKKAATELEEKISNLLSTKNNDWEKFLEFALSFANSMGSHFLEISQEDRLRCKQILFPAGFRLDENGKVYTPEISPIYRLATTKKDLPETEKSFMVRVGGL